MDDFGRSPLLKLSPPKTYLRRKQQPRFPPPPTRIPLSHEQHLRTGVTDIQRHVQETAKQAPELATDSPYLRVELAPKSVVSEQELNSLGLVPVLHRADSVFVSYSTDKTFKPLSQQLKRYGTQEAKLPILAKIESFSPCRAAEKLSPRLAEESIQKEQEYIVDVFFMPLSEGISNPHVLEPVRRFIKARKGEIIDHRQGDLFQAMRLRIGGQALNEFLKYRDDVLLVDLPPKAQVLLPAVSNIDIDELDEISSPETTAPAICIVDSGIVESHPLLQPAVVSEASRSFPASLGSPIPIPPFGEDKHGTQVAGIALYGDVGSCAINKKFEPRFHIINARILDQNNSLSEERMPFIRDITEHAHGCRIFNLSFGLDPAGAAPSVYSVELDTLAREKDILFVISSGNKSFRQPLEKAYPDYMLDDPSWAVLTPAESFNALTVGGLTPARVHEKDPIFAPERCVAPFSRSGGLKGVVKPELIEEAGNYILLGGKLLMGNERATSVPTTNPGGLLAFTYGTSFSAPKIANLAACILDKYRDATLNLLRALLVQSANYPEGVKDWDKNRRLKLCGFGVPDEDRALYCRPERATLFMEGVIEVDATQLFEIPVPEIFAKSAGEKRIIITLAYDPPISATERVRPRGIVLTWGLARGDVPEEKVKAAIAEEAEKDPSESEDFASPNESENEPEDPQITQSTRKGKRSKSPFMSGLLPKNLQKSGTIQKNIFSWKQKTSHGETYYLALTAKATQAKYANDSQRYALVVTLEGTAPGLNVYQPVRLKASRIRVRVDSGIE